MNENVTIKTPKRRRWIARLLVSALCILLASSLLFVSVVAENVNSFNYVASEFVDSENVSYYLGRYFKTDGSMSYCIGKREGGFVRVTRYDVNTLTSISYYDMEVLSSDTVHAVGCSDSYCWYLYSNGSGSSFTVYLEVYSYVSGYYDSVYIAGGNITLGDPYKSILYFSDNGHVVYLRYTEDDTNKYLLSEPNGNYFYTKWATLVYGDNTWNVVFLGVDTHAFSLKEYTFYSNTQGTSTGYTYYAYSGYRSFARGTTSGTWREFTISNGVLGYNANVFSTPLSPYYGLNFFRDDFISSPHFSDTRVGICWAASRSISYISASSSEYTPPESSDETITEPPPESSEESSEPPSVLTNIWKVDRGLKESLAGSIDLSGATRIRAFLGVFTSSGSSFASDRAVPLTIEVYRNGLGSPDTYTFDFFAYGWGATSNGFPNSYDSYTFPDVVGLYYDIPIPADGEGLLFPTFAPYGSIYVNFSDSVFPDDIQRVTFNLHNSQGYLDVNFISSSSTSFTIYNDDLTKGKTYTFESGTFNYKCFFDLDGEYSETEWFSPQFGSSIKYSAEDVLESGLYAIYSFNDDSIEYPWGNGEWSEAISNANSRLDQVSLDYEILESKANEAYGQFSFNSMTGQDFIGAVSNFETIKDSSGGSYILDYFFGMWNVHPFASSMIAIVGTLAIVGFIIRKL